MIDGRLPRHEQGQYLLTKRAVIIKAPATSKTSLETVVSETGETLHIWKKTYVFLTKNKG